MIIQCYRHPHENKHRCSRAKKLAWWGKNLWLQYFCPKHGRIWNPDKWEVNHRALGESHWPDQFPLSKYGHFSDHLKSKVLWGTARLWGILAVAMRQAKVILRFVLWVSNPVKTAHSEGSLATEPGTNPFYPRISTTCSLNESAPALMTFLLNDNPE